MRGDINHKLRNHVVGFAVNLYINTKKHGNVLDKAVEIVNYLLREKAIYRLELMSLKTLRKAYLLTTNNQTFYNPTG